MGTLWNARRYSGLMLANLITLAHVRRQLKLENRAFVDSPRHPNTAVMAFDNRTADGKANSHTTLFGREHRVENMIVVRWDQSVRRLLENYHNDPEIIEHRAASGKRRKTPAGCPVKVRPFCASKQQKKRPFSLTQNQPPKTGRLPHDLRDHMGGVGGTRGRIHKTSCSVVISARRE